MNTKTNIDAGRKKRKLTMKEKVYEQRRLDEEREEAEKKEKYETRQRELGYLISVQIMLNGQHVWEGHGTTGDCAFTPESLEKLCQSTWRGDDLRKTVAANFEYARINRLNPEDNPSDYSEDYVLHPTKQFWIVKNSSLSHKELFSTGKWAACANDL